MGGWFWFGLRGCGCLDGYSPLLPFHTHVPVPPTQPQPNTITQTQRVRNAPPPKHKQTRPQKQSQKRHFFTGGDAQAQRGEAPAGLPVRFSPIFFGVIYVCVTFFGGGEGGPWIVDWTLWGLVWLWLW